MRKMPHLLLENRRFLLFVITRTHRSTAKPVVVLLIGRERDHALLTLSPHTFARLYQRAPWAPHEAGRSPKQERFMHQYSKQQLSPATGRQCLRRQQQQQQQHWGWQRRLPEHERQEIPGHPEANLPECAEAKSREERGDAQMVHAQQAGGYRSSGSRTSSNRGGP